MMKPHKNGTFVPSLNQKDMLKELRLKGKAASRLALFAHTAAMGNQTALAIFFLREYYHL